MAEQLVRDYSRPVRLVLVAVAVVQLVAAGVALWLVRDGWAPVIAAGTQRILAYGWVALTIAGAVGAYGIARGAAGSGAGPRLRAAVAGAALADFATTAGIVVFCVVGVWPILAVALLVGLLGLVLGWPPAGSPSAPSETARESAGADALR